MKNRLIVSFAVVMTALLLSSVSWGAEPKQVYPPYPEIWAWFPGDTVASRGSSTLHRMPNGDVLVSYSAREGSMQRTQAFFSRATYPDVESVFGGTYPSSEAARRITLKNGNFVKGIGGAPCERGLSSVVFIEDAHGRELQSISLLMRLDQPMERPAIVCEEQEYPSWRSRLAIINPGTLSLLKDGTFLVVDAVTGTVVRLSSDLEVGPKSRPPRIVAIDSKVLTSKAGDFARDDPSGGIDWPAYFDHLLQTQFD